MVWRGDAVSNVDKVKFLFKWKSLSFCKRREDPIELNYGKVVYAEYILLFNFLNLKFYWGSRGLYNTFSLILKNLLDGKREKVTVGITA